MKTNPSGGWRVAGVRTLLTALTISTILTCAAGAAQRELFENRKVEVGQKQKESHQFFQTELVKLTGTYTQKGIPVDLSGTNTVIVWEINGWIDYTNTYALCTGLVSSVSNVVSFTLAPQASNLKPGTYLGFVRALHSVSNELVQDLVLSYQTISVEWSPGSANYNMVAPLQVPQIGSYTNPAIWFLSSAPRREISQIWKVEDAPTVLIPTKFFMAEGVGLSGRATKGGAPIDLTATNTFYVWEIIGWNDYTNTYAIALGTASTNGQLRFELPPWQSNLSNGTYRGFVRSLTSDGTNVTSSEVLARQTIAVEWSPDSRHYGIVGPYTQPVYYTTNLLTVIGPTGTNGLSAYEIAVSNGFVGSVSNWLASLVGPHGDSGTNDVAQYIRLQSDRYTNTVVTLSYFRMVNGHPSFIFGDSNEGDLLYYEPVNEQWAFSSDINFDLSGRHNHTASQIPPITGWVDGDENPLPDIQYFNGTDALQQAQIDSLNGGTSLWNTAYGWGNHSTNGYLTTFTEIDPAWHSGTDTLWKAINEAKTNDASQIATLNTGKVSLTDATYTGTVAKAASALQAQDFNYGAITNPPDLSVYATGTPVYVERDTNALAQVSVVSQRVERVVAGTDAFEGILLDREINVWEDIGLTYSNAVRINHAVVITNDSAWTGWTTTGDLLTNGVIFLTEGEYLQSPVQSNGISSYSYSAESALNATFSAANLYDGTNIIYKPYAGTNGVLKITCGETLPGATPGVSLSNAVITGYNNREEAATDKTVSGLGIIDPPSVDNDAVNKAYSDAGDAGAMSYADSQIDAYAGDSSKPVIGDSLELGNYTVVGSGLWRGINFTQSANSATIGTAFDSDIISLESGVSSVTLNSITYVTTTNITLGLYAQNIIGAPMIGATTNLMNSVPTAFSNIAATVTSLGGGYYSAAVNISGLGSRGFFRASATNAPASAGSVIIHAGSLNLDSHAITNVARIVFTNGWKIVCSTNGLQFQAP